MISLSLVFTWLVCLFLPGKGRPAKWTVMNRNIFMTTRIIASAIAILIAILIAIFVGSQQSTNDKDEKTVRCPWQKKYPLYSSSILNIQWKTNAQNPPRSPFPKGETAITTENSSPFRKGGPRGISMHTIHIKNRIIGINPISKLNEPMNPGPFPSNPRILGPRYKSTKLTTRLTTKYGSLCRKLKSEDCLQG